MTTPYDREYMAKLERDIAELERVMADLPLFERELNPDGVRNLDALGDDVPRWIEVLSTAAAVGVITTFVAIIIGALFRAVRWVI